MGSFGLNHAWFESCWSFFRMAPPGPSKWPELSNSSYRRQVLLLIIILITVTLYNLPVSTGDNQGVGVRVLYLLPGFPSSLSSGGGTFWPIVPGARVPSLSQSPGILLILPPPCNLRVISPNQSHLQLTRPMQLWSPSPCPSGPVEPLCLRAWPGYYRTRHPERPLRAEPVSLFSGKHPLVDAWNLLSGINANQKVGQVFD